MLRLPGAGRYARGLGRAALALDFPAARTVLLEAVDALGIVATWDDVARPVLAAVARRWATTGAGVEIEHLLSQSVAAVFSAHVVAQAGETDGRPVLLAGMPHEQHTLPLLVLAAALGDRGVPVQPMGTDLPCVALVAAVRRTAPAAVVLWSQLPGHRRRRPVGRAAGDPAPVPHVRGGARLGRSRAARAGAAARVARRGRRRAGHGGAVTPAR